MQIGTLTAFLQYLMQILMAVMMATFMAVLVPRAAVCADRIGEVLEHGVVGARRPTNPVTELDAHGTVEFVDVELLLSRVPSSRCSATSPSSPEPGRTTAIIGSTGAGKTTLVNLIPRLFDATSGIVLVDGVDVAELDPDLLWSRIGLVPQKPYLFSGTVASQPPLRQARRDGRRALARAGDRPGHATSSRRWPRGWTRRSRRAARTSPAASASGSRSPGRWSKRPEIYVFDDSFSALDTATDARLRAALARDVADATMIVVAQRVSTIVDADQIIVLDDGRVVGRGTHDELLRDQRDLRRDRLVAAHRGGSSMSTG